MQPDLRGSDPNRARGSGRNFRGQPLRVRESSLGLTR